MQKKGGLLVRGLGSVALIALAVGCYQEVGAPGSVALSSTGDTQEQAPSQVLLCKIGPEGATADFTVTADGPGTLPLGSSLTLTAGGECILGANMFVIWVAASPRPDPLVNTALTVAEVGASAGTTLHDMRTAQYMGDIFTDYFPPTSSATITTNYVYGGWFKFANAAGDKPPQGGEGCTPGYWKNHTHLWDAACPDADPAADVTTTYQTCDLFNATFGVTSAQSGLADDVTLLAALSVDGPAADGCNKFALARHATGALLNADAGIDYPFTTAEIIELYQDAVGAIAGDETVCTAHTQLEGSNELGCPCDNAGCPGDSTAANIAASQGLFKTGLLAELLGSVLVIFVVLAFYRLFKDVDQRLAVLLVITGGILPAALMLVNFVHSAAALQVSLNPGFLSPFDKAQRESLVLLFLHLQQHQITAAQILWGVWLFPMGLLTYKSGFLPRFIGVWLLLNGAAYVLLSVSRVLIPGSSARLFLFAQPLLFGELAMLLWLLVKGAKPTATREVVVS